MQATATPLETCLPKPVPHPHPGLNLGMVLLGVVATVISGLLLDWGAGLLSHVTIGH